MTSSSSDMDIQVIEEFLDESRAYADTLNKDLLIIEELIKEGKGLPEDILNEIFRAAHTIKGTSSFLGFNNVFKLMHNMETILDEVRKGKREFEADIIDIVFESFDVLEALLKKVEEEGNDEHDLSEILQKLKALIEGEPSSEEPAEKEVSEKPAISVGKTAKETKAEKQIINDTLGDEFLFSNIVIKSFDLLDEMDVLKQKNNSNNVFEAYIEKENIPEAMKVLSGFADVLRYFMLIKGEDTLKNIEDENAIDENAKGLYLILSGKKYLEEVSASELFTIKEVYHYKESILSSMPPKEKKKFLQEFIDNTVTQMEEFSDAMIKLEDDPKNEELINAAFRSMHTIKGSAGFIGMSSFGDTAHKIENIMSKIREGELEASEEVITLMLKALDAISVTMSDFKKDPAGPTNLLDIQLELDNFTSGIKDMPEEAGMDSAEEAETPKAADSEGKDVEELVSSGFELDNLSVSEQTELKDLINKGANIYELDYTIEKSAPMKSLKASLIETKLEREGVLIKSMPDIDDIADSNMDTTIKIIYATNSDKDSVAGQVNTDQIINININKIEYSELTNEVDMKESDEKVTAKEPAPSKKEELQPAPAVQEVPTKQVAKPITTTTVRVDIDKLDSLMNLAGELVITKARFGQILSNMKSLVDKSNVYSFYLDNVSRLLSEVNKSTKSILSSTNNGQHGSKDYKKTEKLFDMLDDYMGKLMTKSSAKDHLSQLLEFDENTILLGKISSDLQNGIMQTRMVPVENVFSRFKRVVRDLSKSLNKSVRLEIYGEDTELDKKIIDELADPLTHMIRNSLDHGVESKEERLKKGKDETGIVTLSAYHKGNHICIEVSDDGKGLNSDIIVESAIKKELMTAQEAESLSEDEKLNLIFLPGFSSAKEITGVSGRGVGMDVVRKMIESINGSVDITTEIDRGTKFILNIPLTLAIIQALLVVVSDEIYAIPLESVIEVIKIKQDDIYHIDGGETIKLRGHALSIIDLRDTIKIKKGNPEQSKYKTVVVVTSGEEQLGIVLDSLIGEQEIVIKALSDHFSSVKGIVGASVLGNGTISLILDIQAIIRMAA